MAYNSMHGMPGQGMPGGSPIAGPPPNLGMLPPPMPPMGQSRSGGMMPGMPGETGPIGMPGQSRSGGAPMMGPAGPMGPMPPGMENIPPEILMMIMQELQQGGGAGPMPGPLGPPMGGPGIGPPVPGTGLRPPFPGGPPLMGG